MKNHPLNQHLQLNYRITIALLSLASLLFLSSFIPEQQQKSKMSYTISMENPDNHYFHVSFTCQGLESSEIDFKLPSWTPGYYKIMDYAKNITGFKAVDGTGNKLGWMKTSKNTWRVSCNKADIIIISYDVYSFRTSVAESFLDDGRGFISPTGIFMYVNGKISHPVSVKIIPYKAFSTVSTGLEEVQGEPNTYKASDFDVLYDCPILTGNNEIINFTEDGIPYTIAAEKLGDFDRNKLVENYKKMIHAATSIVGEIPYKHYTFLVMNRGGGGLEHSNSQAVFSNPGRLSEKGFKSWMSFTAHEFFHLYNVKSIRPLALGPFDYNSENYTTMLWFSEGVTSYYENIILNRAGIFSRQDVLEELTKSIANYENIPGHLFQSAAESSFDAWIYWLDNSENIENTTISYYDKGVALGMLLDLKIRYESAGRRSLDDVMKTLYQVYFKEKKRGFTDEEFRKVCEDVAGKPLTEIFESYIPTVQDVDYKKYLGYAGLNIDQYPVEIPGSYLGASIKEDGNNIVITRVELNSPAYQTGLSAKDVITEIDNNKPTVNIINDILKDRKPGDSITLSVTHRDFSKVVHVRLGKKTKRSFEIKPEATPSSEQKKLLENWLK